jgi:hypothetical protein
VDDVAARRPERFAGTDDVLWLALEFEDEFTFDGIGRPFTT